VTQLALCLVPGPLTLMGLPFYLPAIQVSPIYTFNVAGWHLKGEEHEQDRALDQQDALGAGRDA